MADSFSNEASDCLLEQATESLTQMIWSKTQIHSVAKYTVLLRDAQFVYSCFLKNIFLPNQR